jgi:16S rRNA (guanine966-N2)-methyltransferase
MCQGVSLDTDHRALTTNMRVIAGQFRSRPLHSMRGLDIRPTSDRLRETLFNVLTAGNPQALEGSVWVDLFAGTGAVGIEAISRGAAMVYFVDQSRRAAELIRQNLESLKIPGGTEILQQEVSHAISNLAGRHLHANFVFLDPPYLAQNVYRETLEALASSEFVTDALIIVEHEKRFDPGEKFGELKRSRKLEQGDAALSFYPSA